MQIKKIRKARGLYLIGKNKMLVDVNMHWDIMEDVIDRIIAKEARKEPTINWEEFKSKMNKRIVG